MTSKIDKELEVIFGGAGKRVVLRECSETYGLTLIDAVERPDAFRAALLTLVGELGSTMVMGRIARHAKVVRSSKSSRILCM